MRILLLTHKDSDNLGDQFIEANDMAILRTIVKNLGIEDECEIISEKASIVTPEYVKTGNPNLLKTARKQIREADLVIVGGAPQFNYLYQYFSDRSCVLVKLAEKYQKPIVFSAIGIEDYNPEHPKCQRLKKVMNFDVVKMITTRDNIEDLKRIRTREDMIIDLVSDPAVFSGVAFRNCIQPKPEKKKIGLFIIRGGAFDDNNISFGEREEAKMWKDIITELQLRDYDYELITSGHYSDEAFMDYLVRSWGVKLNKCVFNMYLPEQMIEHISTYSGVVTCRLHPSIISYSLKVPSVSVVWNPKVPGFYNAVGYGDRTIEVKDIDSKLIVDKLEKAMSQGVHHNEEFVTSVYRNLFKVIKNQFCPDKEVEPYSYSQILEQMPTYEGTTEEEAEEKLIRKTRRCYNNYNNRDFALKEFRTKYNLAKNPVQIRYFSRGGEKTECRYEEADGQEVLFSNGGHEYSAPSMVFHNNGTDKAHKLGYVRENAKFLGWKMRVRSDETWFWVMKNGGLATKTGEFGSSFDKALFLIEDEGVLPKVVMKYIDSVVLEAVWE